MSHKSYTKTKLFANPDHVYALTCMSFFTKKRWRRTICNISNENSSKKNLVQNFMSFFLDWIFIKTPLPVYLKTRKRQILIDCFSSVDFFPSFANLVNFLHLFYTFYDKKRINEKIDSLTGDFSMKQFCKRTSVSIHLTVNMFRCEQIFLFLIAFFTWCVFL